MELKNKYFQTFFLSFLVCPGLLLANVSQAIYSPRIELGTFYENHRQKHIDIDALIPIIYGPNNMVFADLRLINRQGPSLEGNLGLGYRGLNTGHSAAYGFYGFFDRRRSNQNNYYNQITLGGEYKPLPWSYTVNTYFPIGTSSYGTAIAGSASLVAGNNALGFKNILINSGGLEKALRGTDWMAGYTLSPCWQVRGGLYYFSRSQMPTVWGPQVEMEYQVNPSSMSRGLFGLPNLSAEIGIRRDKPRGTQLFGGLRLAFGGAHTGDPLSDTLLARIYRDLDIVTSSTGLGSTRYATNADGTLTTVAVTQSNAELTNAINNNANVIAVNANLTNVGAIFLKNSQTLTGGNYAYEAENVVTVANNGSLGGQAGVDLLRLSTNNTIQDIRLNVDGGAMAIVNDGDANVGHLTIKNITSTAPVNIAVADGSANSHIDFSNNNLGIQAYANLVGVNIVSKNNSTVYLDKFDNNTINLFGPTSFEVALSMSARGTTNGTGLNNRLIVDSISHNTFNTGDGDAMGIEIFSNADSKNIVDNITNSTATVTINSLANNTITNAGNTSVGIYAQTGTHASDNTDINNNNHVNLTISSMVNNAVRQTTGTNGAGMAFLNVNMGSDNQTNLSVGTFTGNTFSVPANQVGLSAEMRVNGLADTNNTMNLLLGATGGLKNNTLDNGSGSPTILLRNSVVTGNTAALDVYTKNGVANLSAANGGAVVANTAATIHP